jgi:hypothetical protein
MKEEAENVQGQEEKEEQEEAIDGKQQRKPRAKKSVIVSVLAASGESSLVEWTDKDGDAQRCYVPSAAVEDVKVALDILEEGIPYGAPWGKLAEGIGLPEKYTSQFAGALYRRGVWTAQDLERNPKSVIAALVEVTGITASALRRAALAKQ